MVRDPDGASSARQGYGITGLVIGLLVADATRSAADERGALNLRRVCGQQATSGRC